MKKAERLSLSVLVLAPIGRDAATTAELLRKGGMEAEIVRDLAALIVRIAEGAGAVFVAEEALFRADLSALTQYVESQPRWSDIPFVVLTSHLDHLQIKLWRQTLSTQLGSVAMLERPVQPITLSSAMQVALRARRKQYEIKALIEAREQTAEQLETLVAARTKELQSANEELRKQMDEREQIEASLRQSMKMEAVGQLTGGLAHDFNNMLTGIGGSVELIKSRLAQGRTENIDRYIAAAQSAVKRAAALTHRLLAFSRRQTLEPKPTSVNRLVVGMEELIRRTVGPLIHVEVVGAAGLWTTLIDPNQLENG